MDRDISSLGYIARAITKLQVHFVYEFSHLRAGVLFFYILLGIWSWMVEMKISSGNMVWQDMYGVIPNVKGKGKTASLVSDILLRMQREQPSLHSSVICLCSPPHPDVHSYYNQTFRSVISSSMYSLLLGVRNVRCAFYHAQGLLLFL